MQGGENLKSIAKSVWGDSNLWYLIANANNLEVDSPLTAGQTLKLPARVNVVHNDADTFTPYNPSEAIGNTTPTLPMPANSAGGCGGAGAILVVVVAIVVTVLTEGATSDFLVESLAWAQGAADVAGAVVGAAAGSIASQGVAIAIGQQESFSWSAVAMSALSAGVTRGFAGPVDGGWVDKAKNAALANATTQGVAVLTGMQDRFDWRSVVASAVSAGVGEAVGSSETLKKLGVDMHRGLTVAASRTAAAVVSGGKVSAKDIAIDAFGNVLGLRLAEEITGPLTGYRGGIVQRDSDSTTDGGGQAYLGELIAKAIARPERGAMNYTDYGYEQSVPLEERLGLVSAPQMSRASDGDAGSGAYLEFSTNLPEDPVASETYVAETIYHRGIDRLEAAAISDSAFYRDAEGNATNGFSAVGWHIGGLLNETGYDLARTARGAYRLVTDANARAAAYGALKFAVSNPAIVADSVVQGAKKFANKPFGEQADSIFKFAAGEFATAGTGKLGMLAVDGTMSGVKATSRWLAPKAAEMVESYMTKTGALVYAIEPGNLLIPDGLRGSGKVLAGNMGNVPEGYQAHHLVMSSLAQGSEALEYLATKGLYDINRASNGLALPGDEFLALADNLPLHKGFHGPEYRSAVISGLERLDAAKQSGASDAGLLKRIGILEKSLSNRLQTGELWLNNRDAYLRDLGPFEQK